MNIVQALNVWTKDECHLRVCGLVLTQLLSYPHTQHMKYVCVCSFGVEGVVAPFRNGSIGMSCGSTTYRIILVLITKLDNYTVHKVVCTPSIICTVTSSEPLLVSPSK